MKKIVVFRFDIDTHKCIRDGVPNLLRLAKQHQVHFTFFLNTGKSVNFIQSLTDMLYKKQDADIPIVSFSPHIKLGLKDYWVAALLNPRLSSYHEQIQMIASQGHELGLHGGSNHADWHRNATSWQFEKISSEIDAGLNALNKLISGYQPFGFASPGWTCTPNVWRALSIKGFQYAADVHTDQPFQEITKTGGIHIVPTNILGEPGGVAYFEHCRAKGMNDNLIIEDFFCKLEERDDLAVVYDHPYYAGCSELQLMDRIITMLTAQGYKIKTFKDVITSC